MQCIKLHEMFLIIVIYYHSDNNHDVSPNLLYNQNKKYHLLCILIQCLSGHQSMHEKHNKNKHKCG